MPKPKLTAYQIKARKDADKKEAESFKLAKAWRNEVIVDLKNSKNATDVRNALDKQLAAIDLEKNRVKIRKQIHLTPIADLDKKIASLSSQQKKQFKLETKQKIPTQVTPKEEKLPKTKIKEPELTITPEKTSEVKSTLSDPSKESKLPETKPPETKPPETKPTEPNPLIVKKLEKVKKFIDDMAKKRTDFATTLEDLNKNDPKNVDKITAYTDAEKAAGSIHREIQGLYDQAITGKIDIPTFKKKAAPILAENNKDVQTLRTHRGYKELLINIAFFIGTLGIGLIAAAVKGRMMVFHTDTKAGVNVDKLKESIEKSDKENVDKPDEKPLTSPK